MRVDRTAMHARPLVLALSILSSAAATPAPRSPPASAAPQAASIPDLALVDQTGRTVRFKGDVLRDRVAVIDFVFTTCATICPVLSASFARLQERLGERLARDVQLVSISIDPARDTPARLRAYAHRYHAGPHWTWLTGPIDDVERVLNALGAYTPDATAHAPLVLVGDARSGTFSRVNGFPNPERLVARVDEILAARAQHASKEGM